jgi:hypothetical protein
VIFILIRFLTGGHGVGGTPCKRKADPQSANRIGATRSLLSLRFHALHCANEKATHLRLQIVDRSLGAHHLPWMQHHWRLGLSSVAPPTFQTERKRKHHSLYTNPTKPLYNWF